MSFDLMKIEVAYRELLEVASDLTELPESHFRYGHCSFFTLGLVSAFPGLKVAYGKAITDDGATDHFWCEAGGEVIDPYGKGWAYPPHAWIKSAEPTRAQIVETVARNLEDGDVLLGIALAYDHRK